MILSYIRRLVSLFLRRSAETAEKRERLAEINIPTSSINKISVILLASSPGLIGSMTGTMTMNKIPWNKPRMPPANAASNKRVEDFWLLEWSEQTVPVLNASSQAIGVIQTTPG